MGKQTFPRNPHVKLTATCPFLAARSLPLAWAFHGDIVNLDQSDKLADLCRATLRPEQKRPLLWIPHITGTPLPLLYPSHGARSPEDQGDMPTQSPLFSLDQAPYTQQIGIRCPCP